MACILVTGAAGFLGSAVVEALADRGDTVVAMDLAPSERLSQLAAAYPAINVQPGEITEWALVARLIQTHSPAAVVHCAAVVGVPASVQAPFRTMQVNVEGSLNVMEAMRLFGVKRMVHISSEETYGPFLTPSATEDHPQQPMMPYGISKLAVEHLGRSYGELYGLECIHIRTSWVYGPLLPRNRIPKNLVEAALAGRPLQIPSGADFAVDHTHVSDVVQGILLALDRERHPFDAYNMGSGAAPTLREIVAIVKELVPGAELGVGDGPYLHAGGIPTVVKGALDISRARSVLGYAPRFDIRAGLSDYVQALRGESRQHQP